MKMLNRILGAFLSVVMLVPTTLATVSAASPTALSAPVSGVDVQDNLVSFNVGADNIYEIDGNSSINLTFVSPVTQTEVEKVQLVSLTTGESLNGKWQGAGTQWEFIPYDIKDATYYTIVVPADLFDQNGNALGETVSHTFRTANGLSEDAKFAGNIEILKNYTCESGDLSHRPAVSQVGHKVDNTYRLLNIVRDAGGVIGMQLDLRNFSGFNNNVSAETANVRLYPLEQIWNDANRSYVGKTVSISFMAKASVAGQIRLTLNQLHTNDSTISNAARDYTFNNYPGFDETADLTTEWQTFTYSFTVTDEMYDQLAYGRVNASEAYLKNIAVALRFPGFTQGSGYNGAQITMTEIKVAVSEPEHTAASNSDPVYVAFGNENINVAESANLRFAVKDDSVTTVDVYAATLGEVGEKLGSVAVNGAGIYSFDITDYAKSFRGYPTVALKTNSGSVALAPTGAALSIVPTNVLGVLPEVSSSVLATDPNNTQSGLWISGGQSGFDTDSVKSYVKLSLDGYTGGYIGFLFNAMTNDGAANVYVYGVADVEEGQNWTPETLTSFNAPANDIYGGGVNLNDVYGNAPLAAFRVGGHDENYRVYLTDFAEHMLAQGATEITLVLVSDSKNVTNIKVVEEVDDSIIAKYNCVTTQPTVSQSGFGAIGLYQFNDDGFEIYTDNITTTAGNTNANVRIYIFDEIWNKGNYYVNKTIRFSFSARASEAGSIALSLTQTGNSDKYVWGNGFKLISQSTNLNTSWQTFTYEFIVTQAMIDGLGTTINNPGLSLGVRFYSFNTNNVYNYVDIDFRNFVVSEVKSDKIYDHSYDFSTAKPTVDSRGYNNTSGKGVQIPTVTNGELKVNLSSELYVQTGAYVRIAALDDIFANTGYIGKTFTITFKAKATESGVMDFAFNKLGTTATYVYGGTTYASQYTLTTEYQTFTYQFVVVEDMFTTHASTNLNLAFRFHNGYKSQTVVNNSYVYKNAQIYIDDLSIVAYNDASAASTDPVAPIADESYDRVFSDVKYDFSTNVPTANITGYNAAIAQVKDGALQINPSKATNPNVSQFVRVYALDQIWANSANIGKIFTITFRAKASKAGVMDFAINGYNADYPVYSYNGKTYSTQYDLTTEYQTFTYTFTAVEGMFNVSGSPLVCAFRFYNGFRSGSSYSNVDIQIDDIHVYQDFEITKTTVSLSNDTSVSGAGKNENLSTYDAQAPISANLSKTYFGYDLTSYDKVLDAKLTFNLSGATGENLRIYLLEDTKLSANLTYANAPANGALATFSLTAANGSTTIDLTDIVVANEGGRIVLVFAIEEKSGMVQVTGTPDLTVMVESHEFTTEAQRHAAVAPTYNSSGNVEFYSCEGCTDLYVKNGSEFVKVNYEDVVLPPIEYNTQVSGISLNIGKDLSIRYHIAISEGESINDFAINFTMHNETTTVTDYTYDSKTGKYVFSFCGVAPQAMGDTITADLIKGGNAVDSIDYSVKQYVIDALEYYPDDTALKQLLADLIAYGVAAQEYLSYKTNALVNEGIDNLPAPSDAVPTEADRNRSISEALNSDVQFTAAGVRFDYNNRIYVKFKAPSLDGVKVSVGGVDLEIKETNKDGIYIAYSDAISALRFADQLTFTLSYGGQAVQTLVYTINDYALAKHADSRISNLALALYRYGKSAEAYDASAR